MYLIFDASAAGTPKKWNRPPSDPFNWPRLVHLAWLHYDKTGQLINSQSKIVNAGTYEVNEDVCRRTGLSAEQIEEEGGELKPIIEGFLESLKEAEYLFAHNLQFSENVVRAECNRLKVSDRLFEYSEKFCIMREATHFCKLPGKGGGYKWPTLQELHIAVFNSQYANPNNAWSDVIAAANCFFELLKQDAIEL